LASEIKLRHFQNYTKSKDSRLLSIFDVMEADDKYVLERENAGMLGILRQYRLT